jgi:hypothetical protein
MDISYDTPPLLPWFEPAAQRIARGVCRRLGELGLGTLLEFRVGLGRRADVAAIDRAGKFVIVEIKSSLADFRGDTKWPDYLACCDFYFFAVPPGFPHHVLPDEHGLIVADEHDAAVIREAPERPMSAARRRIQLLRFGLIASARLAHATGLAPPSTHSWREE